MELGINMGFFAVSELTAKNPMFIPTFGQHCLQTVLSKGKKNAARQISFILAADSDISVPKTTAIIKFAL